MTRATWTVLVAAAFFFMNPAPVETGIETSLSVRQGLASPKQPPRRTKSGKSASKSKASKAKPAGKSSTRRKARPRKAYSPPNPVLADDSSESLETSWTRHMNEFLRASRPAYGAFVAIDPGTGRILALAERTSNKSRIAHPAASASFPAASIFKTITTAALLEASPVTPGTVTCYHGGGSGLNQSHLVDSSKRDRQCRSLSASFAYSTNAVFGKLAVKHIEPDALVHMAESFGFNRDIQIDGVRVDSRSRSRKASSRLDLARMAAGFVNASLSPLHGALIAAIIANDGRIPSGVVFGKKETPEGEQVIAPETARAIQRMMAQTAVSGTGTRYLSRFASRGGVALKTGTLSSRDGSGLFNTWMVGYYPARDPEFAFAALISLQGYGPLKAGHLTRYALDTFLRLKRNRGARF